MHTIYNGVTSNKRKFVKEAFGPRVPEVDNNLCLSVSSSFERNDAANVDRTVLKRSLFLKSLARQTDFGRLFACVAIAFVLFAGNIAHANTITFMNNTNSTPFVGPETEAGFTYSLYSGSLDNNFVGHPGRSINGTTPMGSIGQGTLAITSSTMGELFNLQSLDLGIASTINVIAGTFQDLTATVTGYRHNNLIGIDSFLLQGNGVFILQWATETPTAQLAGKDIDQLLIELPAFYLPDTVIAYATVDNITLNPVNTVPLPGSGILFGTGLLFCIGFFRYRRLSMQA